MSTQPANLNDYINPNGTASVNEMLHVAATARTYLDHLDAVAAGEPPDHAAYADAHSAAVTLASISTQLAEDLAIFSPDPPTTIDAEDILAALTRLRQLVATITELAAAEDLDW